MLKRLPAMLCSIGLAFGLGAGVAAADPAAPSSLAATFTGTVPLSSIVNDGDGDGYALFMDAIEEALATNAETVIEARDDAQASEAIAEMQQAAQTPINASPEPPAAVTPPQQQASSLAMEGAVIPYVGSYLTATAPQDAAGLWYGSDSTTDGSWGYFIGHNPGIFECLLAMGNGSVVTVADGTGAARTYTVFKVFDVPNTTTWEDIQGDVTGYGESIILQTCIDGGTSYRIMVAR